MTRVEPAILQVRDLVRAFGGIVAVNDFNLDLYPGSIHGLIGPNGAGKTTTFNVISGFYAPTRGKVIYLGEDISGRPTSALARMGPSLPRESLALTGQPGWSRQQPSL